MLETRTMTDQASRLRQITSKRSLSTMPAFPHVITVTSGKGGVGKSMVSLNLSIALCGLGKSVLLVDADSNLGNLDVLLGITPKYRLGDVLRGDRDIEDVLVSPMAGLRLLPGSSGDVEYPLSDVEIQRSFIADLQSLEERADFVVIDTAAGLTPEIVGFAVQADETIVVTTPEPTAVMDAYAMIKVIHLTKSDVPVSVVMNSVRVPAEAEDATGKLVVAVHRFLNTSFSYLGAIPFDQHVTKSVTRQRAVIQEFPTSGASLSVKAMAQHLLKQSA